MMYHPMRTVGDFRYNFRIFKLVHFLYTIGAIDVSNMAEHVRRIEDGKPAGLFIDYGKLQYQDMDGRMIKI